MNTIVVMPGGFHPFHAGHAALYNSARQAFPDADVYVAATNSQEERPFPFSVKEKLAKVAGVEPGHFVQVKSPFSSEEITSKYDPNDTVLIFVKSQKNAKNGSDPEGPFPAEVDPSTGKLPLVTRGPRKGQPVSDRLQYYKGNEKNLQPMSRHSYLAYLPTVKFGPGITSASEIRNKWPTFNDKRKLAMVMSLYPATQKNPKLAQNVVGMLDQVMGGQEGLAEGLEQQYLWHGSRQKIPMLEPRQSVDTGGAVGSNQNAIYATSDPKVAIAMGLTTPGSDTGMFPNDPQMVLFSGKIRKGENVYLHKVPMNGPDGKPQFVQGGNSREFHSVSGVEVIKPTEIKAVPVDKYLNLIRQATQQDLELRKKYMKQGVAEGFNGGDIELSHSMSPDILYVHVTSDGSDVGGARFKKIDGVWTGDIVHVYPQFRRQGVATKIYDYAEELVGKINPSKTLKPKGKKFWSSRDTQGVAEGSEEKDNLIWTLNSFGYYSDNSSVYVNDDGDKIVRVGSEWKHQSGKRGRGPEELGNFLSSNQGVAEARSNPERNRRSGSGKYDLINYAEDNITDKDNWAVSMTVEPKLGINPQAAVSEDTPKGIYFYPLRYFMQMADRDESLPWGNDYPYIQLFQYDRSREMTKKTKVDPAKLKKALLQYCPEEVIQQASEEGDYDGTPYWFIYDCLSRLGNSDETNIVRWNKVLRDLGFTSVYDDGRGWIAYNEPTQGVVLDPRIIKQHKMFDNRNPTLQNRRYDIQGLADAIGWSSYFQRESQLQRIYNHPDEKKVMLDVAKSMLKPFLGKSSEEADAMGYNQALKAAADKVIEILKNTKNVDEGFGLPMPGTYEQEHGTRTPSRKQHITAMTYENDMSKISDYIDEK